MIAPTTHAGTDLMSLVVEAPMARTGADMLGMALNARMAHVSADSMVLAVDAPCRGPLEGFDSDDCADPGGD